MKKVFTLAAALLVLPLVSNVQATTGETPPPADGAGAASAPEAKPEEDKAAPGATPGTQDEPAPAPEANTGGNQAPVATTPLPGAGAPAANKPKSTVDKKVADGATADLLKPETDVAPGTGTAEPTSGESQ